MDTIHIGITGDKNLAVINQIINQRENLNCEFHDSHVGYDGGAVINNITLELYDDNTIPKKLTLKKKSDPAPTNTVKVWEGVLAAESNLIVTVGYRDK